MTATRLNPPMRFELREVEITSKVMTADWQNYVLLPDVSGMVPVSASLQLSAGSQVGLFVLSNPHKLPNDTWQLRIYTNWTPTITGVLRVLYVSV